MHARGIVYIVNVQRAICSVLVSGIHRDVKVRQVVEEKNWCMQWSGEVLPEAEMIPDLTVFLCTGTTRQRVASNRQALLPGSSWTQETKTIPAVHAPETVPARLKLPFTLGTERSHQISQSYP